MSVSLSGYGGKDPVNEFRKASLSAFNQLIYEIQKQMVLVLNNIRVEKKSENQEDKKIEPITKKIGGMILVLVDQERNTNNVMEVINQTM